MRRLCRLPGEDRAGFTSKVRRLSGHFERFNEDVSGLCQWLMRLRKRHGNPGNPADFGTFAGFLLEPALVGDDPEEDRADRWRRVVFDGAADIEPAGSLDDRPIPEPLRQAMDDERAEPPGHAAARRLFGRLRDLDPAHRLVLLKAAAEWVVARYRRGVENWTRLHDQWKREKHAWEQQHPELTTSARDTFNEVFRSLRDPEESGTPGVRRKNPRICPWERLKLNIENCAYAGQKGHGSLCWKFAEFVKARKQATKDKFNDRRFWDDAEKLVEFCVKKGVPDPARALQSPYLGNHLFRDATQSARADAVKRLKDNWNAYLLHMGLNGTTIITARRLPHCRKIGETFEKSRCEHNPHTELCNQYRRALAQLPADVLALEGVYREWRRLYLAGPAKPSFRYPSARDLPTPKIFGRGYYEIDFERSVLRLRLDDMRPGEWIEFGVTPWPRDYSPSRTEVGKLVTSVHVHFVGTRARVGFRFDVEHRKSRFECPQDTLDELRSRRFPSQSQDQEFLQAARDLLLRSFPGGETAARHNLRLLAVDLGETGAHAAVYTGTTHDRDVPLEIIKIDRAYSEIPPEFESNDPRGVRKEHVKRHLDRVAAGASSLAEHRQQAAIGATPASSPTLGDHDFRRLKRHITWMIRDWARHNAARIVAAAEEHACDLIVFESLRGFRLPGYDQLDPDKKRRLAMFAFGRVRCKVVEKAVERGMRVVTVPYFKSSQVCSACGTVQKNTGLLRKNKKSRKFVCEACKVTLNSDANAARVLARVFWGQITLPNPSASRAAPGSNGPASSGAAPP